MSSLTNWTLKRWVFRCCAGGDRSARLSSCDASEDLPLRLVSIGIQSSRRLERESQRNIELMWLTGRLDAGLQDDRRLPPRQRAGDPRGVRAVRRAVPSVQPFLRGLSLRSTGASSRRSTIATRTSQWPRSPSALNRWRPASRATWGSWTVPTGRTAIWPRPRQPAQGEDRGRPAAADAVPQGDWQAG